MLIANARQMRECDRYTIEELGLPGIALMESAGRGATEVLLALLEEAELEPGRLRFGVMAGGGNNGGDGFVVARRLLDLGCTVDVVLLGVRDRYAGDAAIQLALLERVLAGALAPGEGTLHGLGDALAGGEELDALLEALPGFDVIVDGLLGTGLSKEVRSPYLETIDHINASGALVLALDIPSGVCSDTGRRLGAAVEATATATFALPKFGHVLYPGRALAGRLEVVDIGIPLGVYGITGIAAQLLDAETARLLLPERPLNAHKGTFGHVLVVGGAAGKGGALAMSGMAALRTGAGLVTTAGAREVAPVVTALQPELMTEVVFDADGQAVPEPEAVLTHKTVLALGPGLGTGPAARSVLERLLERATVPCVLDADALNLVAAKPSPISALATLSGRCPIVLTPHPGEFGRLAQTTALEASSAPIPHALALAAASGCVVVLKGAATVIAHPAGLVAVNSTGNPGMATAGMGDVLTGIIASFIAQGLSAWDSARVGVYCHGLAGDIAAERSGMRSLVASDVIAAIGEAIDRCEAD